MKRYKASSLIGMFFMAVLACMLAACTSQSTGTGNSVPPPPSNSNSATPTVVLQNPGDPIISIRMIDRSKGWALTDQDILFTTDGGQEWKKVTPTGSSLTKYVAGDFMNGQYAWVVSTAAEIDNTVNVWRTSDGGQHWQSSTIAVNEASVIDYPHFLTTQEGFLELGIGGHAAGAAQGADIFHTTDGGQNWTKVSDYQDAHGLPLHGNKTGISFKDAQNGWATGTYEGFLPNPWLYVTHDGGHTWSAQSLINLPGSIGTASTNIQYTTTPPVFFGNNGFLPIHVQGTLDGSASSNVNGFLILKSTDGGASWFTDWKTNPTTLTTFASNDLYIATTHNAWATDQSGNVYGTSDGGENWSKLASTVDTIYALSFPDASYGWAISNTSLWQTTDGGSTWNKISYHIIA